MQKIIKAAAEEEAIVMEILKRASPQKSHSEREKVHLEQRTLAKKMTSQNFPGECVSSPK